MTERITPRNDSFFSSLIKDSFKMNESFKTDPSLATSARAAKESGSYLCASNVTPTAVRFIVSVFLCVLCSCRMSSTQMTCSHFQKNRPKKRQKPAGCRSRIISKNRPVPIFGRSTGASLVGTNYWFIWPEGNCLLFYDFCFRPPRLKTFSLTGFRKQAEDILLTGFRKQTNICCKFWIPDKMSCLQMCFC